MAFCHVSCHSCSICLSGQSGFCMVMLSITVSNTALLLLRISHPLPIPPPCCLSQNTFIWALPYFVSFLFFCFFLYSIYNSKALSKKFFVPLIIFKIIIFFFPEIWEFHFFFSCIPCWLFFLNHLLIRECISTETCVVRYTMLWFLIWLTVVPSWNFFKYQGWRKVHVHSNV